MDKPSVTFSFELTRGRIHTGDNELITTGLECPGSVR